MKVPGDSPLFCFSQSVFHSRYSLVRMLDASVFKANLSLSDYSWHSFRRGAAMFAFELGLDDSAVQLFGDWSSRAFVNYLEFAFSKKAHIAKKIARNFDVQVKDLS